MSHFKERIALFKNISFSWFLISCITSTFGNGITYIAMSWLVLNATGSISHMAILLTCFWGPNAIVSPFFGVLVDRFNRKWCVFISNFVRALILLIFWLLYSKHMGNAYIYLLSATLSIGLALYMPASMALTREIVSEKDLLNANAAIDIAYELGNISGMGLAGLIIALTSIKTTFLINVICYLIATVTILFVKHKDGIIKAVRSSVLRAIIDDFNAGIQYLIVRKKLLTIYSLQAIILAEFMTAPVLLAPFAKHALHASVGQFGEIEAALSIGVVLGGIFSPYFADKFSLEKVLLIELLITPICFYLFKNVKFIFSADILYFLIGLTYSAWPLLITRAQELTALEFQGRVQSVFNFLSGLFILIIYGLIYFESNIISLRGMYWIQIAISIIAILIFWRYCSISED